jgi:GTP-binding protein
VSTGRLNRWLRELHQYKAPPRKNGKPVSIRYMTQVKTRPPTFAVFSPRSKTIGDSYMKFLTNSAREEFNLQGVPIRLLLREPGNPYDDMYV